MRSKESEAISELYRSWAARATADSTIEDFRRLFDEWGHLTTEPGSVDYIEVQAGPATAMWIVPKESSSDHVLLCSHGGGYIGGSMFSHRKLFGHVAKAIGCRALNVDYRLAPEFPHPGPLDDMTDAYEWLIKDQGIAPGNILLLGDSAGGALCLTNIENIRRRGLPLPGGTMPISPWCCGDHSGESYQTNKEKDLIANPDFSKWLADIVLGADADIKNPTSNPLYIDYAGFPPIYLQVGGDEAVLDDARRVAKLAQAAGVDVEIDVFPGMQHCFQLMAGNAPEADDAGQRLARWARNHWNFEQ